MAGVLDLAFRKSIELLEQDSVLRGTGDQRNGTPACNGLIAETEVLTKVYSH
jgi:hypothetical protein